MIRNSFMALFFKTVLCFCFLPSTVATAIVIEYQLTPLGGDAFRYDYTVINDGSLGIGVPVELFDILFEPTLYLESSLNIVTPEPLASNWDEIILASAPGVPAAYDALALAGGVPDGSSLSGFAVEFIWLGGPSQPGDQEFEIFDPITFDLLETGTTRASAVPEPGTWALFATGLIGLGGFRKWLIKKSMILFTH